MVAPEPRGGSRGLQHGADESARNSRRYGGRATSASPAVGVASPSRTRKVVVFPAPLGPRKPVDAPRAGRAVNGGVDTSLNARARRRRRFGKHRERSGDHGARTRHGLHEQRRETPARRNIRSPRFVETHPPRADAVGAAPVRSARVPKRLSASRSMSRSPSRCTSRLVGARRLRDAPARSGRRQRVERRARPARGACPSCRCAWRRTRGVFVVRLLRRASRAGLPAGLPVATAVVALLPARARPSASRALVLVARRFAAGRSRPVSASSQVFHGGLASPRVVRGRAHAAAARAARRTRGARAPAERRREQRTPPRRRRGTRPHRPRPARLGRSRHQRDRCPRRRRRLRERAGRTAARWRRSRRSPATPSASSTAAPARCARATPRPRPGWPRSRRCSPSTRRRSRRHPARPRAGAAAAGQRRPGRVPDPAGGAHQRGASRGGTARVELAFQERRRRAHRDQPVGARTRPTAEATASSACTSARRSPAGSCRPRDMNSLPRPRRAAVRMSAS